MNPTMGFLLSVILAASLLPAVNAANSTCASIYTLNKVCSGQGECEPLTGRCICNEGWTGLSAWVNRDGIDCQVNETAVKVLWAIQIAVCVFVAVKSYPSVRGLYSRYLEVKQNMASKGRPYHLWNNVGIITLICYWGGSWTCHLLLALVKLASPNQRIGVNAGPTLLWIIARSSFYLSSYLFQPALLKSLLKGSGSGTSFLERKRVKMGWAMTTGAIIIGAFTIFIPLAAGNDEFNDTAKYTELFFNIIMTITLFTYSQFSLYIKHHINDILNESNAMGSNDKMQVVRNNLNAIQNSVVKQTLIQTCIYLAFACWPFLWTKYDYLVPISFTTLPLIGKKLSVSLYNNTAPETSSRKKSGFKFKRPGAGNSGNTSSAASADGQEDTKQVVSSAADVVSINMAAFPLKAGATDMIITEPENPADVPMPVRVGHHRNASTASQAGIQGDTIMLEAAGIANINKPVDVDIENPVD